MTLIGISLLAGLAGMICPSKHKKYLRLVCGFCMIASLIAPLPSYLENADVLLTSKINEEKNEEAKYEEIYHQTLAEANAKYLEDYTKILLIRDFSTKNEDISVSIALTQEEDSFLLKKATVFLSGGAILKDPREIAAYVEALLTCPCEIVYQ